MGSPAAGNAVIALRVNQSSACCARVGLQGQAGAADLTEASGILVMRFCSNAEAHHYI